jgi:hypothetical protein
LSTSTKHNENRDVEEVNGCFFASKEQSYFTVCFDYFSGISLKKEEEAVSTKEAGQNHARAEAWQVQNTVREEELTMRVKLLNNCQNNNYDKRGDFFLCERGDNDSQVVLTSSTTTGRRSSGEHEGRAVTSATSDVHERTTSTATEVTHRISTQRLEETSEETTPRLPSRETKVVDEVLNSKFMRSATHKTDINRYTQMLKDHDKDRKRD